MTARITDLLHFNRQILEQALTLATAHQQPGTPPFAEKTGPHLRHIIEHYESLARASKAAPVDYDRRARDRAVESDSCLAVGRIQALIDWLSQCNQDRPEEDLQICGQVGLAGEFSFVAASSFSRELAFLASHSVHHFALLKSYCDQNEMKTCEDLGKAPSTVAYERSLTKQ